MLSVNAVKTVRFYYKATPELHYLFQIFRQMCNDAIRIAIDNNVTSCFDLTTVSYPYLKRYRLHSHYSQNACEVAYAVYKRWREDLSQDINKDKEKNARNEKIREILYSPYFEKKGVLNELVNRRIPLPYVRRPFIKLDNQTYHLNYLLLRIPTKPRQYIFITLNGSMYHRSYLADQSLKRGSITITDSTICIAFSRKAEEIMVVKPLGQIGIDVNERNVTWSDTRGKTEKIGISGVAEIKEKYKHLRANIGRKTRQDRRISQRLYAKYGKRERNRTVQLLHIASKKIVQHATQNHLQIVMEKLTKIRKLYRKGNGQGRNFRGRMKSWSFHEIQRQIEYKAKWESIPVTYINPRGTSRNCLCGTQIVVLAERKLYCPRCDKTWDRDELASLNIMMMAAPQVRAAQPDR